MKSHLPRTFRDGIKEGRGARRRKNSERRKTTPLLEFHGKHDRVAKGPLEGKSKPKIGKKEKKGKGAKHDIPGRSFFDLIRKTFAGSATRRREKPDWSGEGPLTQCAREGTPLLSSGKAEGGSRTRGKKKIHEEIAIMRFQKRSVPQGSSQ